MMAASEDVTAWRHILTSQPDVTPDSMLRAQHLQSQDDLPHQPVPTRRANLSWLSAPAHPGWPHRPEVTWHASCKAAHLHTHPPQYINPMYSCPSLSLAVPLDQNTTPHCTCNPVYYIKIILDLGCFRPPAQPAHLYKSRFSVLACNNWQTLRGEVDKCVWEKHTEMHWRFDLRHQLMILKKMWNLPPG
jgi:hypothetical protein